MAKPLNTFDRIANHYDKLNDLVFGSSIVKAQCFFLDAIGKGNRVLIVGGGTGKLLRDLTKEGRDLKIEYVEASAEMINLARQNVASGLEGRVHFVHGTQDAITDGPFDVVITNFFLDLFSDRSLSAVISKLSGQLKPNGIYLATDFTNSRKLSHRFLLKTMYIFFRSTCKIEANQLPDWQNALMEHGLAPEKAQDFFGGFIRSLQLRKVAGQ